MKKVKDSDNIEDIKNKTQELSVAIQKIGAELYKSTGGQNQNPPQENKGPETEEGEYKEK